MKRMPHMVLLAVALIGCKASKSNGGDTGFVIDPADTTSITEPGTTTPGTTTPDTTTPTGTTSTGTTTTPTDTALPPMVEECETDPPPLYAARLEPECGEPPVTKPQTWREEWHWSENPINPGFHQVMASPSVGPLVDTNGDGFVDDADAPTVVFTAFAVEYRRAGVLVAIRGDTGETLWSIEGEPGQEPWGAGGVAIGDVDGTGPAAFVAALGGVLAVNGDGSIRWHAEVDEGRQGLPYLVDIEGDGTAEVVFGASVINADGSVRWQGTAAVGGEYSRNGHAVDLDGDGVLEVIAGGTVYESDGTVRWSYTADRDAPVDGFSAAADIDGDGEIEVLIVSGSVALLEADGTEIWTRDYIGERGGAPVIADLDGDGELEIGVAFLSAYRTFEADGTERWSQPWNELGGENGSAVFDFDGDGAMEILANDQDAAYVLDGATRATELVFAGSSSGTLYEFPVPVDSDGDGAVEILVPSNDYSRFDDNVGIFSLGADGVPWPEARRVWSQHHYWDGAQSDDGRVAMEVKPGVGGLRNADQLRVEPLLRANLALGREDLCLDECVDDLAVLWIPVESTGAVMSAESEVIVTQGVDELARWAVPPLVPGEVAWLGPIELTAAEWADGIVAVVDIDEAQVECREDDNISVWGAFPCL